MWRGLVVVTGALMLLWPAICNGYPLLYPDSISYLRDGGPIGWILFLHAPKGFIAMRSEIYSLVIYGLHWKISAWPVVAFQALLTAYVLWLVVRTASDRPKATWRLAVQYLALTGLLSLTTSLGWYVSFIMPDILGPVLYLCIYLLVFARESLSAGECWGLAAISCFAVTAHTTHLMLGVGVFGSLVLLGLMRWPPIRLRTRGIAAVGAVLLVAAAAQVALHGYLYGKLSLFGNHMPYLTARVVADGPGRWYLRQHCAELHWAICKDVDSLPDNDDEFLWGDRGVWQSASAAQKQQLLREETPLVIAAVRAYPVAQAQRSFGNFWHEFTDFGLWDFQPNTWMQSQINNVLPGTEGIYLGTREARETLPVDFFSILQNWTVAVAAIAISLAFPMLWLRQRWQMLGLVEIVAPTVIANALLTAVLSESDSRYQARIIWLVPMVAGMLLIDWGNRRRARVAAEGGSLGLHEESSGLDPL